MPTLFRSSRSSAELDESTTRCIETKPFLSSDDVEFGRESHRDFDGGDHLSESISGTVAAADLQRLTSTDGGVFELSYAVPYNSSRSQRRWRPFSICGLRGNKESNRHCQSRWTKTSSRGSNRRPSTFRRIIRLAALALMILGIFQLLGLVLGVLLAFFPNHVEDFYSTWSGQGPEQNSSHWPTDYTADILPVRCHSHNDYWRKIPLTSAIKAGCTGVEADVWLYDGELFVGHTPSSLVAHRTFSTLYIEPIITLLEKQNPITRFQPALNTPRNGVFDTDAEQSLVLLIDFKTNGEDLWPAVQSQLEPLRSRNYLTHFDGSKVIAGPVTVVATGNTPFHRVIANTTYRDIFFDAPLAELAKIAATPSHDSNSAYDRTIEQEYLQLVSSTPQDSFDADRGQGYSGVQPRNPSIYTKYNSYYASTSLKSQVGWPFPYLSEQQRAKLEAQIRGAHIQGLQVRYWSVPDWPISWRNYLWRELVAMGIDYLNVDDLKAATKGSWRSQGSYGKAVWGSGDW